jgi:hypothetical protein
MAEALHYLSETRSAALIKRSIMGPLEIAGKSVLLAVGIVGALGLSYAIAGPRRR